MQPPPITTQAIYRTRSAGLLFHWPQDMVSRPSQCAMRPPFAIFSNRNRPHPSLRHVRMLQGSAKRPLISVGCGFVQQGATYVPREMHGSGT